MKKKLLLPMIAMAVILLISGCGKESDKASKVGEQQVQQPPTDVNETKEPVIEEVPLPVIEEVTLSFYTPGWVTNEEFQSMFIEPTRKKHPNIHLNHIVQDNDRNLDKLILAKEIPDLIIHSAAGLKDLLDLGLAYNMDPLIKQFNLDLDRLKPVAVEMVKVYSGNGQLTSLPYTLGFRALYYNRDLFEKFAVPYPEANMTWEEAIQLARAMTRLDDNIQYYGLAHNGGVPFMDLKAQLGLPYIDANTNKAVVHTDQWKNVFESVNQIYLISGNQEILNKSSFNQFVKNQALAMLLSNNDLRQMIDINWDVTSIPTMKENPDIGYEAFGVALAIPAQSKYKEAAFQVLANTLSDEVQLQMVRDGRPSVLKDEKFVDNFGKDMPNVTDQHLSDIFAVNFRAPQVSSKYNNNAQQIMNQLYRDVVFNGKDINSALREAEERINSHISAEESK